ncbi:MAG: hypothetical protein MHPSP_000612, partial [Paramarteilia canceri]
LCLTYEIPISSLNSNLITIKTFLDWNNSAKCIAKPKTLSSPQSVQIYTNFSIYESKAFSANLKHTFDVKLGKVSWLSPNQPLESVFSGSVTDSSDRKDSAMTSPIDIPPNNIVNFKYETLDSLLIANNIVKSVSLSNWNNKSIFFSYRFDISSAKLPPQSHFTSYELYENKNGPQDIEISFNKDISNLYVEDSVGRIFSVLSYIDKVIFRLRYPLVSNWKTDSTIQYWIDSKNLVSRLASGVNVLRLRCGEDHVNPIVTNSGPITTIITLPEGYKVLKAISSDSNNIVTENISGIIQDYQQITVVTY